ncbi:LEM-3-like GIY-YIG domain-containing protein [Bdellovibrio bacteriovorus]|uniref:LEM-3-like GIY-YIG domain-containing protein n=1 Tax=Bdellovibrio bacteriovorus TaxID=959 RepID=UPI003A80F31F
MRERADQSYYVYVYIDPRNHQEFYYGKGCGDRKFSHIGEKGESEKNHQIQEILAEGLKPIVKVVAQGLTENEALLIETTLIWKLGRSLTNVKSGDFSRQFRPANTLHKDLYNFDYQNGIYCLNVGEGPHRCWDDSRDYGFISAGQDWDKYGSKICEFRVNDIICAYLSGFGYVGIGRVVEKAVAAHRYFYEGKPLSSFPLKQMNMFEAKVNEKDGEFVMRVEWLSLRDREERIAGSTEYWRSRSMFGSLESQEKTLKHLEERFCISFDEVLKKFVSAA